jgi:hypothetical protein
VQWALGTDCAIAILSSQWTKYTMAIAPCEKDGQNWSNFSIRSCTNYVKGMDFTGFLCASSLLSLFFYHLLNVHVKCGPPLSLGFAWFSVTNILNMRMFYVSAHQSSSTLRQQCLIFKAPLLLCHLQETRRLCHQTTKSPVNMMLLLGSPRALLDGWRMHICGLGN